MPHLLHLDSSIDPLTSNSRAVTATFADTWRSRGPEHTVTYRDLRLDPPPHLADASLHWAPELRALGRPGAPAPDPRQVTVQNELLQELFAADVVLIGAPMYNWSVPSTLRAWIDYIHVLGVTVPFGGPTQPMAGRTAVIVSSRGDGYGPGSGNEAKDHTVPPLQLVLGGSLGMRVVAVEVEYTLAAVLDALAERRPQAQANLEAAHAAVRALAHEL